MDWRVAGLAKPTSTNKVLVAAFAFAFVVMGGCGDDGSSAGSGESPTSLVNVFTGSASRPRDLGDEVDVGNTFPGAVAPFGMLQWSPDTIPSKTNYGAGYSWEDTHLRGFSLTHLSGVGCPIMLDVPFLPTTVPIVESPSVEGSYTVAEVYVPEFRHASERGEPGYYRVLLDEGTEREIEVELIASTRAGIGRFTFPSTGAASLLVNAGGSAMANGEVSFEIDPERREMSGSVESGQFCYHRNRYTVYFVATFDRPFASYGTWTKQAVSPGAMTAMDRAEGPFHLRPLGHNSFVPDPPTSSNGAQGGAYVTFDPRLDPAVNVRVAISFVSVENARRNLEAEVAGASLEDVRERTRAEWDRLLGKVRIGGGSDQQRRTFYTTLYRAFLGPTVFSDANGEYLGMDGQVHVARGRTQYTTFSGWDVYRTHVALLAMLVPERLGDMVQSLIDNARQSGWLPRWSVAAQHTNVMVGDPATPFIATARAFGADGFDQAAALDAMVKGATQAEPDPGFDHVQRQGLAAYSTLGYIPHDGTEGSSGASTSMFGNPVDVWGSASTTLEYSIADFALARFAADIGDTATCRRFASRADNWRRLFNPSTGYLQPRYADGRFLTPFEPASGEGWVEGSGAQYVWAVPHALGALTELLGGATPVTERLDEFFTYLHAPWEAGYANLGNQPSHNTPWTYLWAGRPDRAHAVVRRALTMLFNDAPDGYPGNDDLGQTSAWYVFAALGLYPAIPGTDVLVIGNPLFPEATLNLPGGALSITAVGAAAGSPHVQGLSVNGLEHARSWLPFRQLRQGGRLEFDLALEPSAPWGTAAEHRPPSFGEGERDVCDGLQP